MYEPVVGGGGRRKNAQLKRVKEGEFVAAAKTWEREREKGALA